MHQSDFIHLNAPDLRKKISQTHEKAYVLIDVRQPGEYEAGHIPGARLWPLPELESNLLKLPQDKDLIFYCHSGSRSAVAALLAAEVLETEKKIFNLQGGIMDWDDKTLPDYPKVQLLELTQDPAQTLMAAMNLEKGAWRFYLKLIEHMPSAAILPMIRKLSEAETAHARVLYGFWAKTVNSEVDFETVYNDLEGDILEGGYSLDQAVHRLEQATADACIEFLELALSIEYAAYDLYRNAAEQSTDEELTNALLSIAQAEKGHIRMLAGAFDQCDAS
jgi:sulfur-carrier protein adenylyltransferase/sulfurtransferase